MWEMSDVVHVNKAKFPKASTYYFYENAVFFTVFPVFCHFYCLIFISEPYIWSNETNKDSSFS